MCGVPGVLARVTGLVEERVGSLWVWDGLVSRLLAFGDFSLISLLLLKILLLVPSPRDSQYFVLAKCYIHCVIECVLMDDSIVVKFFCLKCV